MSSSFNFRVMLKGWAMRGWTLTRVLYPLVPGALLQRLYFGLPRHSLRIWRGSGRRRIWRVMQQQRQNRWYPERIFDRLNDFLLILIGAGLRPAGSCKISTPLIYFMWHLSSVWIAQGVPVVSLIITQFSPFLNSPVLRVTWHKINTVCLEDT